MQTTDFMTMARTRDWKLVHFLGESFGQLFDLERDPREVDDLWNEPGAEEKKRELLGMLLEWQIGSQYRTRDWAATWR